MGNASGWLVPNGFSEILAVLGLLRWFSLCRGARFVYRVSTLDRAHNGHNYEKYDNFRNYFSNFFKNSYAFGNAIK